MQKTSAYESMGEYQHRKLTTVIYSGISVAVGFSQVLVS